MCVCLCLLLCACVFCLTKPQCAAEERKFCLTVRGSVRLTRPVWPSQTKATLTGPTVISLGAGPFVSTFADRVTSSANRKLVALNMPVFSLFDRLLVCFLCLFFLLELHQYHLDQDELSQCDSTLAIVQFVSSVWTKLQMLVVFGLKGISLSSSELQQWQHWGLGQILGFPRHFCLTLMEKPYGRRNMWRRIQPWSEENLTALSVGPQGNVGQHYLLCFCKG